jgi:hypothetical protein
MLKQDLENSQPTPALVPDNLGALSDSTQEQLAREFAEIEAATAALRQGEPALESWSKATAPLARKPQPVWLIIGVLWLSTAILTAGAVVAIATFAG